MALFCFREALIAWLTWNVGQIRTTIVDLIYARSKLADAVQELISGDEDSRGRVIRAIKNSASLQPTYLPLDLQEEWKSITRECKKLGPVVDGGGHTVVSALDRTMKSVRKKTGQKIALRIWDLYCEVCRRL